MNQLSILSLPDLCKREIFGFLGLRTLVKCRAVNREFKYYADQVKIRNLLVIQVSRFGLPCGNQQFESGFPDVISWAEFSSMKSFSRLDQLKSLKIVIDSDTEFDLALLDSFKNLVHLEFKGGCFSSKSVNLTNLKELSVHVSFIGEEPASYEAFRSLLINALNRLPALKIYLNNVHIVDGSQLEDFDSMKDCRRFVFKNFRRLEENFKDTQIRDIDYSKLVVLHQELSSDFFNKFPSIQTVEATGLVNPDQFERFLANVAELQVLKLINTSLDQKFMNRLPIINNRVTELKIQQGLNSATNFDFTLQFNRLCCFETDQSFEAHSDLAMKVFHLTDFSLISFQMGGAIRVVVIERDKKDHRDEKRFVLLLLLQNGDCQEAIFDKTELKWNELLCLYEQKKKELAS